MKSRLLRTSAVLGIVVAMGCGVLAASGSGQTVRSDGITAARYVLQIDGTTIGTFNRLVNITSQVDPQEYWETSQEGPTASRLAPGYKPPTITLARGTNSSLELESWFEAVRLGGSGARRSVSLTMFDAEGKPVAKYWLEKAWPTKLVISGLRAGTTETLTQTVTLSADYIQRVSP